MYTTLALVFLAISLVSLLVSSKIGDKEIRILLPSVSSPNKEYWIDYTMFAILVIALIVAVVKYYW